MSELTINLKSDVASFEPGEELTGSVSWELNKPPRDLELRLFWFTRGKGTEDAGLVQSLRFEQPLNAETRSFSFRLPEAPYSFRGSLISLVWALELIVEPTKEVVRQEIVVGPGRQQVELGRVSPNPAKLAWSINWRS